MAPPCIYIPLQSIQCMHCIRIQCIGIMYTMHNIHHHVPTCSMSGMTHTESQVSHLKTVALAAQRSRDDLHNKLSEVNMELELVNQRNNFLEKQVNSVCQYYVKESGVLCSVVLSLDFRACVDLTVPIMVIVLR